MSDSSAPIDPATPAGSTAGEWFSIVAIDEGRAYAKVKMWQAWADYTQWRRTFERLDREAADKFESIYRTPASPPDTAK